MFRRFFLATAATAVTAAFLLGAQSRGLVAQETNMSVAELEQLLTGNTAEGVWDGVRYKSYFGPDGTTVYDPQDGDALTGKWRVNPDTGNFESFWDAVGWTPYAVLQTDSGYAWVRGGELYPFDVIEGRNLVE
ncbi:hypothetical protein [Roseovarius sp. D0-M9]|uniref:hypothetical protein n=1 Tax=Roseovarius sp. D0-M9 TaxID=3127117 RepID=UPI00300F7CC9